MALHSGIGEYLRKRICLPEGFCVLTCNAKRQSVRVTDEDGLLCSALLATHKSICAKATEGESKLINFF